MVDFIGRKTEIKILLDSFRRDRGVLNVIRGRRRIGKTRLIRQLAQVDKTITCYYLTSAPPDSKLTDSEELSLYAAQVKTVFELSYQPPDSNWRELFLFISDQCRGKKVLLAIDEINWLAQKSKTFLSEFHSLWETHFSQNKHFMLVVSGSLSSWVEDNFVMHQGYVGRISKDIVLKEMPLPDIAQFFGLRNARLAPFEIIKQVCTIGGVPRYMEEFDVKKDAYTNIIALFFNPSGMLFSEFDKMFNDLFSANNTFYQRLLRTVAQSRARLTPTELATKMGMPYSGRFTKAIEVLAEAGFIGIHPIWNTTSKTRSTKYVVGISDSYTAFYFRAVDKHKDAIKLGSYIPKALPSLIGLQFENLVRNNPLLILSALNIDPANVLFQGAHYQSNTQKSAGCQIDYLIHTRQNTVYVCELKFHTGEIGLEVVEQMEHKLARLIKSKGVSFRPVLIHANAVSDAVLLSDYFDTVIDIGQFVVD